MKTFEIKRKKSSLYRRFIGIVIAWLILLIMTDRSIMYLVSGGIGSLVVGFFFVSSWIHSMSFSEFEIRLKKLLKTKIIKTSEVTKIELLNDRYRLASLQDERIDVPINNLSEEELRKLTKYFKH